jgi:dipeptidyl aminopeptidase/acylaminoacyl peptidase
MARNRFSRPRLAAALLILAALCLAQARRPISHKDFDAWRSIGGQTLTRDGKFLAYSYMPQDGDGDVVVRELATGKEFRQGAGTLPPPPMPNPEQETPPAPRTVRLSFTSDGKFLVAGTYPAKEETERARKERKRPDEMPKPGLMIVNLSTGEATRIANVKSFQVPEKGGSWLAYLKEAPPAPRAEGAKPDAAKPQNEDEEDQQRGGARSGGGAGGGLRKEYGTDLVLRDLSKSADAERTFPNVLEYSFAKDGATLVYAVSSRKEEENGVFQVAPSSAAAPAALLAGKGKYAKLTWDREQKQLALMSDRDDAAARQPKAKVYLWARGSAEAAEAVSGDTPGFPKDMVVSDKGALGFSRDGKRLYIPAGRPPKPGAADSSSPEGGQAAAPAAAAAAPDENKVSMDLWHWRDDFVQPMQRIRAAQERNRTWRGVWHIDEKKYVQAATPNMATVSLSDDGLLAFGSDDRSYRRMVDYDGNYQDLYLVDTATGQRKSLMRQVRGAAQWAPDGKRAVYYNDKHWWLVTAPEGAQINITGAIGVAFHNEEEDTPSAPGSYGSAGWAKDSQSVFLNDHYDVWQVFVDGRPARNVTSGLGRKEKVQYRMARIDPFDEEDDRGIDTAKPLTFRAESEVTRESGFYRVDPKGGAPQRLLWGPRSYRFAGRAREADVLLVTASRFDEFPDLQTTDSSFKSLKKVSDGAKQMAPFIWGTSELIRYRNTDGVELTAALYKPANFDPSKKYPMMVYFYEKLSQGVHQFVEPRPSHNFNFSQYVSDGYIVLTPDIVYEVGQPGQSALKCVLAAVDAVVAKGFVDEQRIGAAGHSWGGYQVAYMVTQTTRFRAAEAGAPVGNMTSAYSGIRWGTGLPRQFQYEKTQSRIGPTLYDNPLKYIENSPVFHIKRVKTPLLILHDDQDDAVPWYQGIELFLALRRNEKEAYLLSYNGELHGLRRRADQMDYSIRMKQFFDHFLKGAPRPEWMEKGVPFVDRDEEKDRFKAEAMK